MQITCDSRLSAYMKQKGYSHIVIDTISPIGCCADTTELTSCFVKPAEAEKIKAKGCRVEVFDGGELLILARGLHYEDQILLKLKNFLGLKDIDIDGIRPWKF